ncbi:MAG: SidA/IucD/PvdA family monooxygenase [Kineosporiaceae bacterium]
MTHDLLGIGIGPFNLGLAALAAPVDGLDAVFLDAREEFRWHPGLMIEGATIQVPFLADLVTMADPTSPYSFLAHLKATGRLYRFYVRESFFPLRAEYDAYCRWVAEQLPSLRFGRRVERVEHDGEAYVVRARLASGALETHRARRLVLGIGTAPHVPDAAAGLPSDAAPVLHAADYLTHRERLRALPRVTVVGSGQSAAEIYHDLLADSRERGAGVDWVTRSPRFFPMEYTKLTLELTSPEYVAYFHGLDPARREALIREQRGLYKGISATTIDAIFETLYRLDVAGGADTRLLAGRELVDASWDGDGFRLVLRETEQGVAHELRTDGVVLATGYAPRVPAFLDGVRDRLRFDARGRLDVALDHSCDGGRGEVFVQNGGDHTHGVSGPDLGMGPWRNATILARVLGREVYPVERRIAFQEFGVPASVGLDPLGSPAEAVLA